MIIRGKCAFSQLKLHWLLCAPANWWINYDVSHLCETFLVIWLKVLVFSRTWKRKKYKKSDTAEQMKQWNIREVKKVQKNQKEFILCVFEKDINSFDGNNKDYSITNQRVVNCHWQLIRIVYKVRNSIWTRNFKREKMPLNVYQNGLVSSAFLTLSYFCYQQMNE